MYRVDITDEALSKIRTQAKYIANDCQSPLNAARWLSQVLLAAESLATMPRRCPLAPEDGFFVFEVRALLVDGFLLLFTIDDGTKSVRILNARHARQLPEQQPPSGDLADA